jgi:hypothetical protein
MELLMQLEIWRTIDTAVRNALQDGVDAWSERQLLRRVDQLLLGMPSVGGSPPTATALLRRHHARLQHELCNGRDPRPLPDDIEERTRELTRAVLVSISASEGVSIEVAVLLGLAVQAGGLARLCVMPS